MPNYTNHCTRQRKSIKNNEITHLTHIRPLISDKLDLTLKYAGGGGGFCPSSTDMACITSIFIKTSQFFLVKADINLNFLTLLPMY
jgi:hypothetical protein